MKRHISAQRVILVILIVTAVALSSGCGTYDSSKTSKPVMSSRISAQAIETGWKKIDDHWYYFSDSEPLTGVKAINGKKYGFDQHGSMVTGVNTMDDNELYYFKVHKDGRAPAVCGITVKAEGKTYCLTDQGFGYVSSGDRAVDESIGEIVDAVTFDKKTPKAKKLEKYYRYLLRHSDYLGIGTPEFCAGWEYDQARDMFSENLGNCYSYGTACGMLARALGYDADIMVGKCNQKGKGASEHCWVLIDGKYVVDGVYEDTVGAKDGKGSLEFFMKDYDTLKSNQDCVYKVSKEY